jgi:WD40 repeat protein
MMTSSWDGSLRVWDLQSGKQIGNDWQDGKADINTIALSPGGKKVVSGSGDHAMRLWDIDTGKVIAKLAGHMGEVYSVCWNRDGGQVVSGAVNDGTARVWDVESGKTILAIATGLEDVYAVIYSPDMTMIATGGLGPEEYLKIWDGRTGKLGANLKGHTATVHCLAWTADGKMLISGSGDGSVRTWNTTSWQQITVLTELHDAWAIAISPNGRILATASWDNTAQLWNLENCQPIGSALQHNEFVRYTSFSTDGKLLTTGCGDKNAYAWDISVVVKEAGFSDLLLNPNVS